MGIREWNIVGYTAGIVVLALLLYFGGERALKAQLAPSLQWISVALFAHVALTGLSAARWRCVVNTLEERTVTTLPRFFGHHTSWIGGDFVARPGLLRKMEGIELKRGVGGIFFERLIDVIFAALLAVPAVLFVSGAVSGKSALAIGGVLLAVLFVVFVWRNAAMLHSVRRLFFALLPFFTKVPGLRQFSRFADTMRDIEQVQLLGRGTLAQLFALTLGRYIAMWMRLVFFAMAIGVSIPPGVLFAGLPIGQLTLVVGLTPGGLGLLEGGWYAVLAAVGISQQTAATFLLGRRVYWLVFTGVLTAVAYLIFGPSRLRNRGVRGTKGQYE